MSFIKDDQRGSAVWASALSAAMGDGMVQRTPTAAVPVQPRKHRGWWMRGRQHDARSAKSDGD